MIAVSIILKSRHKAALFCVMAVLMVAGFATLGSVQKDRYLSIVDNNTANAATSDGRVEGVKRNFEVAARRPIFGHGLGTSLEANSHFTGNAQPAHNLYAEFAPVLGLGGLISFVYFFVSVSKNFWRTRQVLKENGITGGFLFLSVNALQPWLAMNILFSFASYGLSSYEWYLFGGLSVSAARIAVETVQQDEEEMWETACDDYGTSRD
jgi:O-antigen ligase